MNDKNNKPSLWAKIKNALKMYFSYQLGKVVFHILMFILVSLPILIFSIYYSHNLIK